MTQVEAKNIADELANKYGYRNIKVTGGMIPIYRAVMNPEYHGNLRAFLRNCKEKEAKKKAELYALKRSGQYEFSF